VLTRTAGIVQRGRDGEHQTGLRAGVGGAAQFSFFQVRRRVFRGNAFAGAGRAEARRPGREAGRRARGAVHERETGDGFVRHPIQATVEEAAHLRDVAEEGESPATPVIVVSTSTQRDVVKESAVCYSTRHRAAACRRRT
jgi:hypothetical protein